MIALLLYCAFGLSVLNYAALHAPRWVWLAMWRWALARCRDRRVPAAALLAFRLAGVLVLWALVWPVLMLGIWLKMDRPWKWWTWRS